MNILCKTFGHRWRYNFPVTSVPSKRICKRCKEKQGLDWETIRKNLFAPNIWKTVNTFGDNRTDTELCKTWFPEK